MNRLTSTFKPGAMFIMVFAASVCVAEVPVATVSKQALVAKRTYCMTCHGVAAQGFRGVFPIPRLAGQQPHYIKNQLSAFIDKRRTNAVMFRVAHVLSPAMIDGLAAYFATLNPKPLGGAPKDLVAAGKAIFENGIPSQNVPPCASCHGPQAKGADQFPRLAGQLNDYIINKLMNWEKERGQNPKEPDASAIMAPIAHMLKPEQITDVAAYLSYLE